MMRLFTKMIIVFIIALGMYLPGAAAATETAPPNDPYYENQRYLTQIRAPEAWDYIASLGKDLEKVTVAVVDTGVDLAHPDLKDRLVEGTNILSPGKPPQDDNGHGTAVAGVIAAGANNGIGIAGIAPNAQIMPVKAIGSKGVGEEEHLGQGIQYAVDHGADIVVLSLGLHLYSPYLSDIVSYAERQGVLLVAATGNLGETVMYPAAYPTVVAVGGASLTNTYKPESNFGPEVDLLAPWNVYTTNLRGGYTFKEGTSMAAPQVAAVAALMLGIHPDLTPGDIRERLYQSSQPLEPLWNPYSGYGLLQADRAIMQEPVNDMYEPNNTANEAKPVSVVGMIRGELSGGADADWFRFDPPYAGDISVTLRSRSGAAIPAELLVNAEGSGVPVRYDLSSGKAVRIPASNGKPVTAQLRLKDTAATAAVPYEMKTNFHIYQDAYEPNDKAFQAYLLPLKESQEVTGTFHKIDDQDWFVLRVDHPGTLLVRLGTDTKRIDPELYIAREGGSEHIYDNGNEGAAEYSDRISVEPGTYYIRVRNVKALYPLPVTGEYKLTIDYEKRFFDNNEPNNRSYQSTTMVEGQLYHGVFDSAKDEDWFQIRVTTRSLVTVDITGIPVDRYMYYTMYNSVSEETYKSTSPFGTESMRLTHDLAPGVYYIRLMTDAAYQYQQYGVKFNTAPMTSGFIDMENHWARESVEKLAYKGIITGYGNYKFMPSGTLTRAEAATIIARAFNLQSASSVASFPDVGNSHWAKDFINAAALHGIIRGYPDGSFRPNEPVTRAEMTVMAAIAYDMTAPSGKGNYFTDLTENHWAAPYVNAFAEANIIKGYDDGTFRPNGTASRAEFAYLIANLLK